ncbi:MAG: CbiX/SirB N-terminal domain-containing protein [Gammaproteobacteria bacterium]
MEVAERMKSLLVVAHGSRRQASNDEVRELVAKLRALDHPYAQIESAFLELAEPSIPDGLRKLIEAGSTEVVLLPYFLSAGRHVVTDIPGEIEIVREEHPAVTIHLAPYLGAAPGVAEMLLSQAGSIPV